MTRRGTQNQPKITPGTFSGRPVVPKSVPEASRERLGSVSERPGEAWGAWGVPLGRMLAVLHPIGSNRLLPANWPIDQPVHRGVPPDRVEDAAS